MGKYAVINEDTGSIISLIEWSDLKIDSAYAVEEKHYTLELTDEIFSQVENKILNNMEIKIRNKNGTSYDAMFEEFVKPVEVFVSDKEKIESLQEENANLNLQVIDIWETLINGGIA